MPSAFVVYACLGRRPGRFEHHGTYLCLYAECVYVLASTLASMCAMANELYQLCAVCLLWLSFSASQVRLSCRACGGFVAELKGAVPVGPFSLQACRELVLQDTDPTMAWSPDV